LWGIAKAPGRVAKFLRWEDPVEFWQAVHKSPARSPLPFLPEILPAPGFLPNILTAGLRFARPVARLLSVDANSITISGTIRNGQPLVIENVPKAEELRIVSLRLYFKAWAEITEIVTEWMQSGDLLALDSGELLTPEWSPDKGHFYLDLAESQQREVTLAWRKYIEAAQSDLQGIYTLIQQSQEIGLKARICEVSPYLLLKRTDVKPSEANIWDFTDFPTIDATELIRVHNTFCSTVLSKDFLTQYDEIRRNRNKIYHLGIYRRSIDPRLIFDLLQTHYVELYPGRRWMEDRLHFATLHRWANYANDDFNERTALFQDLWHLLPGLSNSQFKWLMRHDRHEQRYICHCCAADAGLGESEPYANDVPTAYRIDEALQVRCVICDKVYAMKSGNCPRKCGCELLSAETESDGACMQCGWTTKRAKYWEEHERGEFAFRDPPPR
jgi:hypothetical protein